MFISLVQPYRKNGASRGQMTPLAEWITEVLEQFIQKNPDVFKHFNNKEFKGNARGAVIVFLADVRQT